MSSFNEKHAALLAELDEIAKKFEAVMAQCVEVDEVDFLREKFKDADKKMTSARKNVVVKFKGSGVKKSDYDAMKKELEELRASVSASPGSMEDEK